MSKIARWSLDKTVHALFKDSNGAWVRHMEHVAVVAALEAENEQLRRQLGEVYRPQKGSVASLVFAYLRAAPEGSAFSVEKLADECDATFGTTRQALLRLEWRGLVEIPPLVGVGFRLTPAGRAWVEPVESGHARGVR